MIRYIFRRRAGSLVALFIFVTAVLFLVQVIAPSDFTVQFALGMNAAQRNALREEPGLNLPLWQPYLIGTDALGRDVLSRLLAATTPSFQLGLAAALAASVIGTFVGAYAGYYRGSVDSV